MYDIKNPYLEQYRELLLRVDSDPNNLELKKQLDDTKQKSEAFVKDALSRLQGSVTQVLEQKNEIVRDIEQKKNSVKLRQEYKTAIRLYRETCDLVVALRDLKKDMRVMIDQNTKKRTS